MQVITELTDKRFFGVGAGQEPAMCRRRIEGAKEPQTLHEPTNKGIYWNQAFRLELAERHMNRPLCVFRSNWATDSGEKWATNSASKWAAGSGGMWVHFSGMSGTVDSVTGTVASVDSGMNRRWRVGAGN